MELIDPNSYIPFLEIVFPIQIILGTITIIGYSCYKLVEWIKNG